MVATVVAGLAMAFLLALAVLGATPGGHHAGAAEMTILVGHSSSSPAGSPGAEGAYTRLDLSGGRGLDVVIFGASGFVGRLVAGYLAGHAPKTARIGLAGRSEAKLHAVRSGLGPLPSQRDQRG